MKEKSIIETNIHESASYFFGEDDNGNEVYCFRSPCQIEFSQTMTCDVSKSVKEIVEREVEKARVFEREKMKSYLECGVRLGKIKFHWRYLSSGTISMETIKADKDSWEKYKLSSI